MKTSIIVKEMKERYLKKNDYLCAIASDIIYSSLIIGKHDKYNSITSYINKAIENKITVYAYLVYKKNQITMYSPLDSYDIITEEDCHDFRLQLLDEMIDFFTKKENDHEL